MGLLSPTEEVPAQRGLQGDWTETVAAAPAYAGVPVRLPELESGFPHVHRTAHERMQALSLACA